MKIHNVYLATRKPGVTPVREDDVEPIVLGVAPIEDGHAVAVIEHEFELSDRGKTYHFALGINTPTGEKMCVAKDFRKTFDSDERPPRGRHTALITDCRVHIDHPGDYELSLTMDSQDGSETYHFSIPSREAVAC